MRRILLFTLLLALAVSIPPAGRAERYASDFTSGTDGWYARGTGTAAVFPVDGALQVVGRAADWNSPGRDFPLSPGQQVSVTVEVRQDVAAAADFILSVAHSNGRETYENLGRATARRGVWTPITASYIPGDYKKFTLYVETMGAPRLDFQIRGFTVETVSRAFDLSLPSLHALHEGYFDFGCAVTLPEARDGARMEFYASQFGIMTHGNELKPDSVLDVPASRELAKTDPSAVAVRLDAARPLMDFCRDNGIKVHGHVLVWHQQTPEAFFREGYSPTGAYVTREVMLGRLENYIRLVLEMTEREYPGLIVSWDVVNEAVSDSAAALRQSVWTRVVGDDFVLHAFGFARKYAREGLALYYNDYSTPYEPKLTGILKLLAELAESGNIDGYGFQCHYQIGTPSVQQVQNAMDKVIALGLRLRMSELDILIDANTPENLERQARRYGALLDLFRKYKDHIDAVHTWGVTDDLSWKASQFPLLFDADGNPKPAFFAVIDPLRLR